MSDGLEPQTQRQVAPTREKRRVSLVTILAFVSFGALVSLLYPIMVLWIPAWFTPSKSSLSFPFFTYVDEKETVTGEPVNLVILAEDGQQIVDAFEKAGLIRLGTVKQESVGAVIGGAVSERVTPISPRRLLGRVQDFGFQSPSSSLAHRHHLRVWRWDDHTWGGKPIWLVSASYDKGLGIDFSGFLPLPSHIVSPNIDDERDFFADLLTNHGLVSKRSRAPGVGPILFRSNGDGAFFLTDGEVVTLTLGSPTHGKPEVEPWPWPLTVRRVYFRAPIAVLQFLGLAQVYNGPASIWMAAKKLRP